MIRLFTRPLRRWQAKLLLASATAVLLSGGALAYYVSTGSGFGSANASASTLNAPTNVQATATPGSGTVPVTWTASVSGGGAVAPQGYYVRAATRAALRAPPAAPAPPRSPRAPAATTRAFADGTYTYTVVAKFTRGPPRKRPQLRPYGGQRHHAPDDRRSRWSLRRTRSSLEAGRTRSTTTATTSGSFRIADAVTDSGSGPASANFPGVPTTGWSGHTASELVTSGTGSPPTITYTSSGTPLYQWSAGASRTRAQRR